MLRDKGFILGSRLCTVVGGAGEGKVWRGSWRVREKSLTSPGALVWEDQTELGGKSAAGMAIARGAAQGELRRGLWLVSSE